MLPCFGDEIFENIGSNNWAVDGAHSANGAAILANDTPVVMAITFVLSVLVVLSSLLADLVYGWLDPRISYR